MGPFDNAIERLGIVLPPAPKPVASYVPYVKTGKLVFISGQLPSRDGSVYYKGTVDVDIPLEGAIEAAKLATINALAVLRDVCKGDLDQVKQIVRLGVFVRCPDNFEQQPRVANGASDLLVSIFGEAGKHARAAVGTNSLPLGAAVEVEMLVELK